MDSRASLVRSAYLVFSVAVFLCGGCRRNDAGRTGLASAVPVQVAKAESRILPRTFAAIGTVQPLRSVAVKSQVDGVIASVHFREGDEVPAGALLVTLDRRPYENSLAMARADLANARAEAARAATDNQRYSGLDQQAVISKEQFAQVTTRAETTQSLVDAKVAAVANAELQLSYTEIRAPIAGRTGQLNLHEGALVKANDANTTLVTLNQLAPISVAFALPESVLTEVRGSVADGRASVQVRDRDGAVLGKAGAVDFIDNAVDATTGTILLKATYPNIDHALWPGRFVDVVLAVADNHPAVVVPTAAVQTGQTGLQVFVVKPDRTVELRPVTVLRASGEFTALAAGLAAGELVVTDGQLRLVPGARIEVRPLAASAAPGPAARPAAAKVP